MYRLTGSRLLSGTSILIGALAGLTLASCVEVCGERCGGCDSGMCLSTAGGGGQSGQGGGQGGSQNTDTVPPTAPSGLAATPVSSSAIDLRWSPSTDDVGVVHYGIYRDGTKVGEVTGVSFQDRGLAPESTHRYAVDAWDAAGNVSNRSPEENATTLPETVSQPFPLKVSADGHHLIDQTGKPFLLTADTSWTLLSRVTFDDAKKVIDVRKSQGFNTILTQTFAFNRLDPGPRGTPFEGGKLDQPRADYWAGVDEIMDYAESQGMLLVTGTLWHSSNGGRSGTLPSTSEAQSYATFLGQRYKTRRPLMWFVGGDYDPQANLAFFKSLGAALKRADPDHLITFHTWTEIYDVAQEAWLGFNSYQWNDNGSAYLYVQTRKGFENSSKKPVLCIEPAYDPTAAVGDTNTTPWKVRRNTWWSILSGASGVVYGGPSGAWKVGKDGLAFDLANYDRPAAKHVGLVRAILSKYAWEKLAPDWNHQVLTQGSGTYGKDDYVASAFAPDGTLFVAHTTKPITVALSKFSGAVNAFWFDPTSGDEKDIGTGLANSGTTIFTTPGANAAGDADWVLVLVRP
jgi:hypothetical protein